MNELRDKQYLGDGVYAGHDGYQLWLYTDNGYGPTNKIALEPNVLKNMNEYWQRITQFQPPEGEDLDATVR